MLHVRLSTTNESLTTIGLVDSGSNVTFVPLELADILSLTVEREDSAVGAGGTFNNTIRKVDIALLKGKTPFARFSGFPVYVPVDQGRVPYVVLGRDAVFRKFDITFRENEERFVLRGSRR